jgi:hypothetical protein
MCLFIRNVIYTRDALPSNYLRGIDARNVKAKNKYARSASS